LAVQTLNSGDGCRKGSSNLVPIENLNAHDLPSHHVKDERPVIRRQSNASMLRAVAPGGLWLGAESGAKIISTTTPVHYSEFLNLRRQFRLSSFEE
jgi:hypothetical protein